MRRLAILVTAAAACATEGPGEPDPQQTLTTALRVVHTVTAVPAIDVIVDGTVAVSGLGAGVVSAFVALPDGAHAIGFAPTGTAPQTTHTLTLATGDSLTLLTIDSSSVLNPWVLTDSGAVVPANRSKVRALHFAERAPSIDIWRTQPDWPTPITFMFPHGYREITPYMESDPGVWTVIVSSLQRAGGVPVLLDTLVMTTDIAVPAGESRTVIVLDAPGGGLTYQVITP